MGFHGIAAHRNVRKCPLLFERIVALIDCVSRVRCAELVSQRIILPGGSVRYAGDPIRRGKSGRVVLGSSEARSVWEAVGIGLLFLLEKIK